MADINKLREGGRGRCRAHSISMASISDTFLSGANAPYLVELYQRYVDDPGSVDPSWASFFADLGDDGRVIAGEARGASWAKRADIIGDGSGNGAGAPALAMAGQRGEVTSEEIRAATINSVRALMLIRSYRVRGHLVARFDPLGLEGKKYHPELDPKTYGFTEDDYDRPIFLDYVLGLETATLRQIMEILQETYCGSIGVEFMHIQEPGEKAWLQQRIESIRNQTQFDRRARRRSSAG